MLEKIKFMGYSLQIRRYRKLWRNSVQEMRDAIGREEFEIADVWLNLGNYYESKCIDLLTKRQNVHSLRAWLI